MVGEAFQLAGRQQFVTIEEHLPETDDERHDDDNDVIWLAGFRLYIKCVFRFRRDQDDT